jgi:Prealbumin-like fold domain
MRGKRSKTVRGVVALSAAAASLCWSMLNALGVFGAPTAPEPGAAATQYEYNTGHLIVVKHVVNDNGRTATAGNFTMTIGGVVAQGGNSFPGSELGTDKVVTTGSYSVSEAGPAGYASTFSSGCSGTISAGQTVTCTVTNNDIAAPLDLVTLCFHGRTIVVQQKFVASLLAQGAKLGPC